MKGKTEGDERKEKIMKIRKRGKKVEGRVEGFSLTDRNKRINRAAWQRKVAKGRAGTTWRHGRKR